MLTNEMKEIMEVLLANRLFLYSLMHKLFGGEPDQELLNILTSDSTCEAYGLLAEAEDDVMARACKFLTEVREDMQKPEFLDRVKNEYTVLFIGPAKLVAPPWSLYTATSRKCCSRNALWPFASSTASLTCCPKAIPASPMTVWLWSCTLWLSCPRRHWMLCRVTDWIG